MSSLNSADQYIVEVQRLCMLVIYQSSDFFLCCLAVLIKNSYMLVCEHVMGVQLSFNISCKSLFQFNQIKYVADLNQAVELILWHDLAVLAVLAGSIH